MTPARGLAPEKGWVMRKNRRVADRWQEGLSGERGGAR